MFGGRGRPDGLLLVSVDEGDNNQLLTLGLLTRWPVTGCRRIKPDPGLVPPGGSGEAVARGRATLIALRGLSWRAGPNPSIAEGPESILAAFPGSDWVGLTGCLPRLYSRRGWHISAHRCCARSAPVEDKSPRSSCSRPAFVEAVGQSTSDSGLWTPQ